nr:MAG TPA: hypothetical protein [Bacteriophage sp.]
MRFRCRKTPAIRAFFVQISSSQTEELLTVFL